jgi:hypothetical protein
MKSVVEKDGHILNLYFQFIDLQQQVSLYKDWEDNGVNSPGPEFLISMPPV